MSIKRRIESKAVHFTDEMVDGRTLKPPAVTVPLSDRQRVFAHSLKCTRCRVEFVIFSWGDDEYRGTHAACPECGHGEFFYFVCVLSEEREYQSQLQDGGLWVSDSEIAQLWPFHGHANNVTLAAVTITQVDQE